MSPVRPGPLPCARQRNGSNRATPDLLITKSVYVARAPLPANLAKSQSSFARPDSRGPLSPHELCFFVLLLLHSLTAHFVQVAAHPVPGWHQALGQGPRPAPVTPQ